MNNEFVYLFIPTQFPWEGNISGNGKRPNCPPIFSFTYIITFNKNKSKALNPLPSFEIKKHPSSCSSLPLQTSLLPLYCQSAIATPSLFPSFPNRWHFLLPIFLVYHYENIVAMRSPPWFIATRIYHSVWSIFIVNIPSSSSSSFLIFTNEENMLVLIICSA